MTTKHNTKHARKRSHYPERLAARGMTNRDVRKETLAAINETRRNHGLVGLPS